MKHLKMLGLASIAAVALTAFVGSGTASATVICKTEPVAHVCPEGWDYPAGTEGLASLKGTGTIETLGGAVLDTCSAGTIRGTSGNTGSATETVKGTGTALTFGSPESPCTKTTDTLNIGAGEVHWIPGTNNGTLTASNVEVTVNTIFGTCVYGTGASLDLGTAIGGTETLTINTIVPKIGGNATCPAETRITGTGVATLPATTAWVAER